MVISRVQLGADVLENFKALDANAKDDFLWKLRETLNTPRVDFQMEGAPSPLDCPTAIQMSAVRFFDGITLDAFARTVSCVFKAELSGTWVVQRHLGPRGYGTGERFDFKRLGM